MSNIVSAIVQRRKVGSGTKKAVLMYFADRASDDGSGIWTSKANIAKDIEISVRSVRYAVNDMLELGIISEVGQRRCASGHTVEYSIILAAVNDLQCTRAPVAPLQGLQPTPARVAALPLQGLQPNSPLTIHEPPIKRTTKVVPKKPARGSRLSDDWFLPKEYGDWAIKEGYASEQIRLESDKFRDFWISKAGKDAVKLDWLATWRNWMRNSKQGKNNGNGNFNTTTGSQKRPNDDAALEWAERAARLSGTQEKIGF